MPKRSHPVVTLADLQSGVNGALGNAADWGAEVDATTPVHIRIGRETYPIAGLHVGMVNGRFAVILTAYVGTGWPA